MRYAITNLTALPAIHNLRPADRRGQQWLNDLRRWSAEGIDFIQLREKTLEAGEVFSLARDAMQLLATFDPAHRPRILINSRADLAVAARTEGVHLTSSPGELFPEQVREVFRASGLPHCTVSISCHSLREVITARERGADLILFGPAFEKRVGEDKIAQGVGVNVLAKACQLGQPTPVLALGGVVPEAIPTCLACGAAGVAGIRLFAEASYPRMRK